MNDITITKLPKNLDINKMIDKQVKKLYGSKCPFCKSKDVYFIRSNSYFGRQHEYHIELISDYSILVSNWIFTPIKYWKEKKRKWYFKNYKCNDCGSEWWTPQYPKINDEEMLTMYDINKLLGFDDSSDINYIKDNEKEIIKDE